MDIIQLHHCTTEGFRKCLSQVGPSHWDLPTPCPDWDVRALVEHVTRNSARLAHLLHGSPIELDEHDPIQAWTRSREAVREGLAVPEALTRSAPSPFGGQLPVADLARIVIADLATHTWDLARALGADESLDPDVVVTMLPMMEKMQPAMAASGKFAPAVPVNENATAQQRFLALGGRNPF